jgi:transcription elongation factor Elf1
MSIWKAKIPLNIKIFLWQVCNDKIQSVEQLKKRNWESPIECKMCGQIESTEHIFVDCALARYGWCVFRDVLA